MLYMAVENEQGPVKPVRISPGVWGSAGKSGGVEPLRLGEIPPSMRQGTTKVIEIPGKDGRRKVKKIIRF